MNKINKLVLKFSLSFGIIITILMILLLSVSAQDDLQGFSIVRPTDRSTIFGVYDIVLFQNLNSDTDQDSKYVFELYSNECSTSNLNYFGKITEIDSEEIESDVFKYRWDTRKPTLNAPTPTNGEYCLVVKAINFDGGNYEDRLEIVINNNNISGPNIDSDIEDKTVILGENFEFDVQSSLEASNEIRYSFYDESEYFQIDSRNGVISTKQEITEPTSELLRVTVRKTQNNFLIKSFYVNFIHPDNQSLYEDIELLSIKEDSVQNQNIDLDFIGLESIDFEKIRIYFLDQNNESSAGEIELSKDEILNNVSYNKSDLNLESENFDLVYELLINKEVLYGRVIQNISFLDVSIDEIPLNSEAIPSLNIIEPVIQEEVENYNKMLEFTIESEEDIQYTTSVFLNQENVSNNCQIANNNVTCDFQKVSMQEGRQRLGIEVISDSNRYYYTYNIEIASFSMDNQPEEDSEVPILNIMGNEVSLISLVVLVGVLILGGLIIIIPWLIFMNWTRKNAKKNINNYKPITPNQSNNKEIDKKSNDNNNKASYTEQSNKEKYKISESELNINDDSNKTSLFDGGENNNYTQPGFSQSPALPESYSDEEIPNWLKDPSGSTPVGNLGKEIKIDKPIDESKSMPYGFDEYGKGKSE